jgi:hypothetical protein
MSLTPMQRKSFYRRRGNDIAIVTDFVPIHEKAVLMLGGFIFNLLNCFAYQFYFEKDVLTEIRVCMRMNQMLRTNERAWKVATRRLMRVKGQVEMIASCIKSGNIYEDVLRAYQFVVKPSMFNTITPSDLNYGGKDVEVVVKLEGKTYTNDGNISPDAINFPPIDIMPVIDEDCHPEILDTNTWSRWLMERWLSTKFGSLFMPLFFGDTNAALMKDLPKELHIATYNDDGSKGLIQVEPMTFKVCKNGEVTELMDLWNKGNDIVTVDEIEHIWNEMTKDVAGEEYNIQAGYDGESEDEKSEDDGDDEKKYDSIWDNDPVAISVAINSVPTAVRPVTTSITGSLAARNPTLAARSAIMFSVLCLTQISSVLAHFNSTENVCTVGPASVSYASWLYNLIFVDYYAVLILLVVSYIFYVVRRHLMKLSDKVEETIEDFSWLAWLATPTGIVSSLICVSFVMKVFHAAVGKSKPIVRQNESVSSYIMKKIHFSEEMTIMWFCVITVLVYNLGIDRAMKAYRHMLFQMNTLVQFITGGTLLWGALGGVPGFVASMHASAEEQIASAPRPPPEEAKVGGSTGEARSNQSWIKDQIDAYSAKYAGTKVEKRWHDLRSYWQTPPTKTGTFSDWTIITSRYKKEERSRLQNMLSFLDSNKLVIVLGLLVVLYPMYLYFWKGEEIAAEDLPITPDQRPFFQLDGKYVIKGVKVDYDPYEHPATRFFKEKYKGNFMPTSKKEKKKPREQYLEYAERKRKEDSDWNMSYDDWYMKRYKRDVQPQDYLNEIDFAINAPRDQVSNYYGVPKQYEEDFFEWDGHLVEMLTKKYAGKDIDYWEAQFHAGGSDDVLMRDQEASCFTPDCCCPFHDFSETSAVIRHNESLRYADEIRLLQGELQVAHASLVETEASLMSEKHKFIQEQASVTGLKKMVQDTQRKLLEYDMKQSATLAENASLKENNAILVQQEKAKVKQELPVQQPLSPVQQPPPRPRSNSLPGKKSEAQETDEGFQAIKMNSAIKSQAEAFLKTLMDKSPNAHTSKSICRYALYGPGKCTFGNGCKWYHPTQGQRKAVLAEVKRLRALSAEPTAIAKKPKTEVVSDVVQAVKEFNPIDPPGLISLIPRINESTFDIPAFKDMSMVGAVVFRDVNTKTIIGNGGIIAGQIVTAVHVAQVAEPMEIWYPTGNVVEKFIPSKCINQLVPTDPLQDGFCVYPLDPKSSMAASIAKHHGSRTVAVAVGGTRAMLRAYCPQDGRPVASFGTISQQGDRWVHWCATVGGYSGAFMFNEFGRAIGIHVGSLNVTNEFFAFDSNFATTIVDLIHSRNTTKQESLSLPITYPAEDMSRPLMSVPSS